MKTSKIYIEKNESLENTDYLKSVYTIPNDLQLVHFSLNSGLVYNEGELLRVSSQFIQITSGTGELIIHYTKKQEKFQLKPNTNFIIPKNVKFTITSKTELTGIIVFDKQQFPSDYVSSVILASMKSPEDLIKEYGNKLVNELKQRESKSKTAGELVELFIKSDPSRNKKFTDWLIKSYLRGGISRIEDLSRANEALEDFNYLLDKKKLSKGDNPWSNEGDINNYFGLIKGVEKNKQKLGLEEVVDSYSDLIDELRGVKKQKIESKEKGKEEGKLVFENEKARIIQPLTTEGACYYGRGTKWCTASTKGDNMFNKYSKDGPMYIIFPKKQGENPNEKYQFHHFSDQYMNEMDHQVDPLWLFDKFDLINEIPKIKFVKVDSSTNMMLYLKYENIIERVYWIPADDLRKMPDDFYRKVVKLQLNSKNVNEIVNDVSPKLINLKILIMSNNNLKSLPTAIYKLTEITELDVSQNKLTELPDNVYNLTRLTNLDISNNKITQLSDKIGNLTQLTNLGISNNKLTQLSDKIGNLTQLQYLDVARNKLSQLPIIIYNITNLKELDIDRNNFTILPEEIGNLINLQTLRLNNNKLSQLPVSIGKLTKLKMLDVSDNKLSQLPDSLGNLINLEDLIIYVNDLTELPNSIGNLTKLQELNISENNLNELPYTIGNLANLTILSLDDNKLKTLPDSVGNLYKLTQLHILNNNLINLPDSIEKLNLNILNLTYNKELKTLPRFIAKLTKLTTLSVASINLIELPDFIGNLINLTDLEIPDNNLTKLPESIGNLTKLKVLSLERNKLTELPQSIGKLINLHYLNISSNNLTELPESMKNLINLENFHIFENKFTELPDWITNLPNLKSEEDSEEESEEDSEEESNSEEE